MKLIKKQISGITYFYIDNLSIALYTSKRYSINLWSEGTQKQGAFAKTLYFDDTLEEWRMRDCECSNKNKSLDFSVVIEENTLKSLETLKAYGVDNGGIAIFNEVYFELHEIGGGGGGGEAPIQAITDYDGNELVPDQSKVVKLPDYALRSDLATVATSGSYNDLHDKPTIPQTLKIINGTYDENEISESYLTYFTQGLNNGPFFKVGIEIKQLIKSGDHYDGEITEVAKINNSLVFTRYNQPDLTYQPTIPDNIIAVDITPETLLNETIPSGWYRWGFDVKLPVNYDFEILGVVSADAFIGGRQTPPIVYQIEKNASPVDGYNVYVGVLFFNSTSGALTGDLTFEAKLLIKKV